MDTISYVIIAVGVAIAALVFLVIWLKKRSQTRCPQCKVPYNVGGSIDWRVVSTTSKSNGKFYFNVDLLCKCNRCGHQRQFQHSFRTSHTDDAGNTVDESLETVIRKYFKFDT